MTKNLVEEQETLMDAQLLLTEDVQKFKNYQEDIERKTNAIQGDIIVK